MNITERLFALQDKKFRDFNSRLIPNIDKESVIGVKTPELRSLAREIVKSGEAERFMSEHPHKYFEENQIHAFIISDIKEFGKALAELERFLPYINNWATCDQLVLRSAAKSPEMLLENVSVWIESKETYKVRFAIGVLMRYFLDERFKEEYMQTVARIRSNEYYVNMMIAWYFATALAKQYASAVKYISENRLDAWTHNKTIQKARESFRISNEVKDGLKKFLRK